MTRKKGKSNHHQHNNANNASSPNSNHHASGGGATAKKVAASSHHTGDSSNNVSAVSQHDVATHWYHVCDSTRYMIFPSTKESRAEREAKAKGDRGNKLKGTKSSKKAEKTEKSKTEPDKEPHNKTSASPISSNKNKNKHKNDPNSSASPKPSTPTTSTTFSINEDPKNTWTVEEDLRLLDAIEQHGLGNWVDVSESVTGGIMGGSNKTARRCMERYWDDYLGRYGHILPPLMKVNPKTLVETTTEIEYICTNSVAANDDDKTKTTSKTTTTAEDRYRIGHFLPNEMAHRLDQKVGRAERSKAEADGIKALAAPSLSGQECDAIRAKYLATSGVILPPRPQDVREMPGAEFAGYMPRRGDFDVEYDNDAERILADMEFSRNDPDAERELKLQVMQIYNGQLEGRYKRKKFVQDHNLLTSGYRQQQLEDKKRPRDERDLVQRMRLFARFQKNADEHREFVNAVLETKRMRKEIAQLQMYRRMGITTLAEAEKYELDKSRREFHRLESAKDKKSVNATVSTLASLWPQYSSNKADRKSRKSINRDAEHKDDDNIIRDNQNENNAVKDSSKKGDVIMADVSTSSSNLNGKETFDIVAAPGVGLLSSKEISLCKKLRLLPEFYLHAKRALIEESLRNGFIEEKGHSNSVVKLDVEKKGEVIEFLLTSGWIKTKN